MNKWKQLLKSRRFWAAVGSVVVIVSNDVLGIPENTAQVLVGIGVAWILSDAVRETK